jgi:hypothetical protein
MIPYPVLEDAVAHGLLQVRSDPGSGEIPCPKTGTIATDRCPGCTAYAGTGFEVRRYVFCAHPYRVRQQAPVLLLDPPGAP